jgi:hypothetical protein
VNTVFPNYVFNNRFRVRKGHQWFINGMVEFPRGNDRDIDGNYRTLFGPVVAAEWQTWRDCNESRRGALTRLLGTIEPHIPGYDALLRANQQRFINQHIQTWKIYSTLLIPYFEELQDVDDYIRLHYADPHPKRELRIAAYDDMHIDNKAHSTVGTHTRKTVKFKLKTKEKGKGGREKKVARGIFDIGVSGSLLGGGLNEMLKQALFEQPLYYRGGRIRFVKSPNPNVLSCVFNELISDQFVVDFICFSDDACFNFFDGRCWRKINLDISKADASYTPRLFKLHKQILPKRLRPLSQRLTDQCRLPFKIRDCNEPKRCVILEPLAPVLYSGSTDTTAINTLANMCIAMALVDAQAENRLTIDTIEQVCFDAGYKVTFQVCHCIEDMQFLKHSPVRDVCGNWQPMLNIGVLLRASGMCHGDLPGRGDIRERALAFQRGLIHGAYPYTDFTLKDCMQSAVGVGSVTTAAADEFAYKVTNDKYPTYIVDNVSFCRRYGISAIDFEFMCELFYHFSYGYSINTRATAAILKKDYDLDVTDTYSYPCFFFSPL